MSERAITVMIDHHHTGITMRYLLTALLLMAGLAGCGAPHCGTVRVAPASFGPPHSHVPPCSRGRVIAALPYGYQAPCWYRWPDTCPEAPAPPPELPRNARPVSPPDGALLPEKGPAPLPPPARTPDAQSSPFQDEAPRAGGEGAGSGPSPPSGPKLDEQSHGATIRLDIKAATSFENEEMHFVFMNQAVSLRSEPMILPGEWSIAQVSMAATELDSTLHAPGN